MNRKLLGAAAILYVLALSVVLLTDVPKRLYWPLYLPILAMIAALLAMRRY